MTEHIDCVVIGAGVVGLAVARACALKGHETILIESNDAIGTQTSSRNSEVIHAGIYYPTNSLKAKLCVQGKKQLYDYCNQRNIPFKRCGKLIVATNEQQVQDLKQLQDNASKNGVNDLNLLQADEIAAKEPNIRCIAALESPSTGIIDSHTYMLSLLGDFENAGGMLALCSTLKQGVIKDNGQILLRIESDEAIDISAKYVINCAGLNASNIARSFENLPADTIPATIYAKGNYFGLSKSASFKHLIYPIPDPGGLGVHLTIDLSGRVRFGPDVQWVNTIDYTVDQSRIDYFYQSIRKYWPGLANDYLYPDYCGIRPKLKINNQLYEDFMIQDKQQHGVAGLINLFGIESPGLTASLAIADYVCTKLNL